MNLARVICLDNTHGTIHYRYGYHLFTLIIWHPIVSSGYSIAFLISEFRRTSAWLDFIKCNNEQDIFMADDADKKIKHRRRFTQNYLWKQLKTKG